MLKNSMVLGLGIAASLLFAPTFLLAHDPASDKTEKPCGCKHGKETKGKKGPHSCKNCKGDGQCAECKMKDKEEAKAENKAEPAPSN